jgi:periplasmic copper chaperone A
MVTKMRPFPALWLSLLLLPAAALAEVEVHEPYAIASHAGAQSGAAFMVIHNHGGPDDRLLSVRSDVAARTELHTHIMADDGAMQMVHVTEGFPLPTDAEILMDRGGAHVMFLGLTQPFEDGLTFDLTLVFEVAGEVTIPVTVDLDRLGEGAMEGHDAHGDHGG